MKSEPIPQQIKSKLDHCLHQREGILYAKAPGRINLIGEHTDYNKGLVLPASINRYMYFGIRAHKLKTIKITAIDKGETVVVETDNLEKSKYEWANFLIGIILEFRKRNVELAGFECAFTSEIPRGAGMSSSSALESAFLIGLNHLYNTQIENWDLIKMSQSSNHNFLGIKGGILDQFSSLFGKKDHLIFLNCHTLDYKYVHQPDSPYSWLLINTGVKHNHLYSGYNDRVMECHKALKDIRVVFPNTQHLSSIKTTDEINQLNFSSPVIEKRARYVIEENVRVTYFMQALENGLFQECGDLLYASHQGLSQDFEVSCNELDFLVECLRSDPDVLGSRMMGGGFGGCTINLIRRTALPAIKRKVSQLYKKSFRIDPEFYAVEISAGASVL